MAMNYYGGLPSGPVNSPYAQFGQSGPFSGGGFSEIAERQRAMGPLNEYQAALAQLNPGAGRFQQQAAMQGFQPAYSMYEAFGVPGTAGESYGSFSDYLADAPGRTGYDQSAIQDRMRMIAGANASSTDPREAGLYQMYYGDDPTEEASRRLAATEMMSGLSGNRANPRMRKAMESVVGRMYNNYLGGTGYQQGPTNTAEKPGGFMDYYLRQRGMRNNQT